MSFRLAARANGYVWPLLRSTYTPITSSRLVNCILPHRTFRVLTHSRDASNYSTITTNLDDQLCCRTLSTKITEENIPIAAYAEIKDLPNHPEKLLIDVREPEELMCGIIPNSISIPLGQLTDALNLSDKQFEKKYRETKPTKSTEIIFYCEFGFRSAKATLTAANLGYTNVKHYAGSWLEYARNEGNWI